MIYAFFGIFAVILGFLAASAIKRREETFEGVVIDKDVVETAVNNSNNMPIRSGITFGDNMGGGIEHSYRVKVKTDAGKEISYPISSGKYEIIKIGDRVSKAKGTTDLEVIASIASSAMPVAPTAASVAPPTMPTPPVSPTVMPSPMPIAPSVSPATPVVAPAKQTDKPEA